MDTNDQILDEFLEEAREIFTQLDLDLVLLEKNQEDQKLVGNIFRAMHTLKGSSGFFAFRRLERVAHAGESLLSRVRDGKLAINPSIADVLLETVDRLRLIVQGVEETRAEVDGDDRLLIDALKALASGEAVPEPLPLPEESKPPSNERTAEADLPVMAEAEPEPEPLDEGLPKVQMESSVPPLRPASTPPEPKEAAKASELGAPIKVSVELLDNLMNLVSELVLGRNRLLSFAMNSSDVDLTSTVRTIDMITLELQERMMKTRMQPISQIWSKFPRLVRDVAQECGKKVELIQIGASTELDRTLLDGIRDPLVHIIRNSIDHGIELPEIRRAKGKPEVGTIRLRAMHENGMVVIEISDDGAGIDVGKVAQCALERGLVTEERLARLSDREIIEFIFLPGFSTQNAVTHLSGRGVGMDVVKTSVQAIGGLIDIRSGELGSNIRLRIPLTLAIMPAVLVRCQGQRFAIPQNNLFEMVRSVPDGDHRGFEDFYGVPVFRLRNKLIPLLFLNRELGLSNELPPQGQPLNIVVVQSADILFGLVVDEVLYMQEVVVKPVGPLLKGNDLYSGATILGDGRVAMIFDVTGIAMRSGLISKLIDHQFNADIEETVQSEINQQQMLLVDLGGLERVALPVDYVDRLEIFTATKIERRGSQRVVLYGEHVMRLISLSDFVEGAQEIWPHGEEHVSVIVHYHEGQPLGLVVKQIHDIISAPSEVVMSTPRQRGILGSAIIGEKAISFLDVHEILNQVGIDSSGSHYVSDPESASYGFLRQGQELI